MTRKEQTLFHIIDTLTKGGAEILLKHSIELLPEFKHIIVYLNNTSDLEEYFQSKGIEVFRLNHKGWFDFPYSVIKLRRLIDQKRPLLVHSHLFYSTLLSRFAVPSSIPLVSTLHSLYSKDAFEKNSKSIWAERISLRKRHSLISVSRYVLQDYLKFIPFKGKSFVLYNFLPDIFFQNKPKHINGESRFIAVGNLKSAKNYEYLFKVFRFLKNENVSLDIYGDGPLKNHFHTLIENEKLKVRLCGSTNNLPFIYRNYDFFIQTSSHEGFGLSVVEAMASGLPCFLSDIPVFHEVTGENAVFLPLDAPDVAAGMIRSAISNEQLIDTLSREGFTFAQENFSADRYKQNLLAIYRDLVPENKL